MRSIADQLRAGTALVLGAGGPVGHGFHAGILAALHDGLGWDARRAELVVGTSAGAGVGALIRAGMSGPDLFDRICGRPLHDHARAIAGHFRRPTPGTGAGARTLRPASLGYLWRAAARPWQIRPGRLVAALLPAGRSCLLDYAAGLSTLFAGGWSTDALWITAVRLRDGAIVPFGHHAAPVTDVGSAVACSSAVPSVYAPVIIDGERYIDGGIASAVHLELLAEAHTVRTAIVCSPLSRMPGMRGRLRAEIRIARRHGLDVIAFEPGPETIRAMGWNPMDCSRAAAVADAAYRETLTSLQRGAWPPPSGQTPRSESPRMSPRSSFHPRNLALVAAAPWLLAADASNEQCSVGGSPPAFVDGPSVEREVAPEAPVAEKASAEIAAADAIVGTYRFTGGTAQREARDAAIEGVVGEMNILVRGIARSRLADANGIPDTVSLLRNEDSLVITFDDRRYVAPLDGTSTTVTGVTGDPLRYRIDVQPGSVKQHFVGDSGGRQNTLATSGDDGLSLRVKVTSEKLPKALEYVLSFRRKG